MINPLTPIGSPVSHENWPMNWPNFAASPVLFGWPARNRHTAACIHRFSHILRWPPEPVVWFMSVSRAVANEHEGHKRTLPIISSSFWMTVGVKGLIIAQGSSSHNSINCPIVTSFMFSCSGTQISYHEIRWRFRSRYLDTTKLSFTIQCSMSDSKPAHQGLESNEVYGS